ncbi:hypothetical protein TUM17577_51270 [Enterobacter asburiae]|nr:hypothetical protein TUM17577_51270 [Enterobacter asburiae]
MNPPPKRTTFDNFNRFGVKISIVDKYSKTSTLAPSNSSIGRARTKLSIKSLRELISKKHEEKSDINANRPKRPKFAPSSATRYSRKAEIFHKVLIGNFRKKTR